jgi:hypothetical protein
MAGDQNSFLSFNAALIYNAVVLELLGGEGGGARPNFRLRSSIS